MIAIEQSDHSSIKLCPENPQEAATLESWSFRNVAVQSTQKTFNGDISGLVLTFGNER